MEHVLSPFAAWESFYVIVGSSAAALTGLQFVVIVLGAEIAAAPATAGTTRAFGTPTVVHFCAALLMSAILSAPWRRTSSAALAITVSALVGFAYTLLVLRHTRRQTVYKPVLEDWIFHSVLPLIAYGSLFASGMFLSADPAPWLFVVGGAALLLLFIGIHNAWDAVTYIATLRRKGKGDEPAEGS